MAKKKTKVTKTIRVLPSGEAIPEPPDIGEAPYTPVYFKPNYHLPLIKMYAREGMKIKEIAEQCGVSLRSFATWRSRYKEIDEALATGHGHARAVVENALFEAALGIGTTVEMVHTEGNSAKFGHYGEDKTIVKQREPDVRAQMFILKNIAPHVWKEKQEIKSEHDLNIVWNEVRAELSDEVREQLKEAPPVKELPEA